MPVESKLDDLGGGFIGAFTGATIFKYLHYKNHPESYTMQSAPWYTGIQITGIVLIVFLIIYVIIKIIIPKKMSL